MYEKILAALRTKYANLGLSNEVLEGYAKQLAGFVKEETEIEAAVSGAEATLKTIQSFGDKRATAEAERVKKELEGKREPGKKEETTPDDVPAWAKSIIESNNELKSKLEGFNAERTSQTLAEKLNGILSEKKVPESFSKAALTGRTFKDESEVSALAEAISSQFETFKHDSVNTGFSFTEPPKPGDEPKKDSDDIAKMINEGAKTIVEQSKTN